MPNFTRSGVEIKSKTIFEEIDIFKIKILKLFSGSITLSEINSIGYKDACKIVKYVLDYAESHTK